MKRLLFGLVLAGLAKANGPMTFNSTQMTWGGKIMTWNSANLGQGSTESIPATDSASGLGTHFGKTSELLPIKDQASGSGATHTTSTSDIVGFSEGATRVANLHLGSQEVLPVMDSATGLQGTSGCFMQWNSTTMTWNSNGMVWNCSSITHTATASDTLFLAESASGLGTHFGSFAESIPVANSNGHLGFFLRTFENYPFFGILTSDSAVGMKSTVTHNYTSTTTDSLLVFDTGSRLANLFRGFTNTSTVTESSLGSGSHYSLQKEFLALAESGTRNASLHLGTQDVFSLAEIGTGLKNAALHLTAITSELLPTFDFSGTLGSHFAVASDRTLPADYASGFSQHFGSFIDVVQTLDLPGATKNLSRRKVIVIIF